MNPDGIDRLRVAVVRRAAQDYVMALRVIHRYKGSNVSYYQSAERMAKNCETFFERDCDLFADCDGVRLMEMLKERSFDGTFWIYERY